MEFPEDMQGNTIPCPHCNLSTVLSGPNVQRSSPVLPCANLVSKWGLPELEDESLRSLKVISSNGTDCYTVDLIGYTCTCPSFIKDHYVAQSRDFGRICKHICAALNRPNILPLLDPIARAIVRDGFGVYPGRFALDNNGNTIYITGVNSTGWLNVFALKRINGKTYYRFGYNINEGRWSYGLAPQINDRALFPIPTSRPLGWVIFWGVLKVVWFVFRTTIIALGAVFMAIVAGLFSGGTRRKRKFL